MFAFMIRNILNSQMLHHYAEAKSQLLLRRYLQFWVYCYQKRCVVVTEFNNNKETMTQFWQNNTINVWQNNCKMAVVYQDEELGRVFVITITRLTKQIFTYKQYYRNNSFILVVTIVVNLICSDVNRCEFHNIRTS